MNIRRIALIILASLISSSVPLQAMADGPGYRTNVQVAFVHSKGTGFVEIGVLTGEQNHPVEVHYFASGIQGPVEVERAMAIALFAKGSNSTISVKTYSSGYNNYCVPDALVNCTGYWRRYEGGQIALYY